MTFIPTGYLIIDRWHSSRQDIYHWCAATTANSNRLCLGACDGFNLIHKLSRRAPLVEKPSEGRHLYFKSVWRRYPTVCVKSKTSAVTDAAILRHLPDYSLSVLKAGSSRTDAIQATRWVVRYARIYITQRTQSFLYRTLSFLISYIGIFHNLIKPTLRIKNS